MFSERIGRVAVLCVVVAAAAAVVRSAPPPGIDAPAEAEACTGGRHTCDDGNICTVDRCDDRGGCTHTYVGDANACEMWVTDGPIYDSALDGDTLYLAGNFHWISPLIAGSFIPLDRETADLKRAFPVVDADVRTAIPDGFGGWFIGGDFSRVGAVVRHNLAHVLKDGSVTDWGPCEPPSFCSAPTALALLDDVVYAGMATYSHDPDTRSGVVAFDASSGAVLAWDPQDPWLLLGTISSLVADRGTIYVGAAWSGAPAPRLWAVDAATASIRFSTETDGPINALALDKGILYVGGRFESFGNATRGSLAAIDVASGLVTPWSPTASGDLDPYDRRVSALAPSGHTLYIGGSFDAIDGVSRSGLAAFNLRDGALTSWSPEVPNAQLYEGRVVAAQGNRVYVARQEGVGAFAPIALDGITGERLSWDPPLHAVNLNSAFRVHVIGIGRGAVWVGGSPATFGGEERTFLAAIDVRTGRPTDWNPNEDCLHPAQRIVSSIESRDDRVYVASAYPIAGTGAYAPAIEALSAVPGEADCLLWSTPDNPGANALALGRDALYAGGTGFPGGSGMALDPGTGNLLSWSPDVRRLSSSGTLTSGWIDRIATLGDVVYVGGWFTSVNGEPRRNLAALDGVTGATLPWNPDAEFLNASPGPIDALEVHDRVYVAGRYNRIGGQERDGLAAVDPWTGLADAWNPGVSSPSIAFDDGIVYLGLAAVDSTTGTPLPWNPAPDPSAAPAHVFLPSRSHARDGVVFVTANVAQNYGFVGGRLRSGLAAIAGLTSMPPGPVARRTPMDTKPRGQESLVGGGNEQPRHDP